MIAWTKEQGLERDPLVRQRLADLAVEVLEVEMYALLVLDAVQRGSAEAGPRVAANKVLHTVACQKIARAALDFGGSEALVDGRDRGCCGARACGRRSGEALRR